jgi:hypothetical protein
MQTIGLYPYNFLKGFAASYALLRTMWVSDGERDAGSRERL